MQVRNVSWGGPAMQDVPLSAQVCIWPVVPQGGRSPTHALRGQPAPGLLHPPVGGSIPETLN